MDRNEITAMYFPDKMTVEEFIRIIEGRNSNKAFIANMNRLAKMHPESCPREKHVERWMKLYTQWMEMS